MTFLTVRLMATRRLPTTSVCEEGLEKIGALTLECPATYFGAMVESRVAHDVTNTTAHARFVVPRTEEQRTDTRQDDSTGTHSARLQRHREQVLLQSSIAETLGGGAYGEQFGMRGRIVITAHPVVCTHEHFATAAMHDDGTYRYLTSVGRKPRLTESNVHRLLLDQRKRSGDAHAPVHP